MHTMLYVAHCLLKNMLRFLLELLPATYNGLSYETESSSQVLGHLWYSDEHYLICKSFLIICRVSEVHLIRSLD